MGLERKGFFMPFVREQSGGTNGMPLIIVRSLSDTPPITIAQKGTKYLIGDGAGSQDWPADSIDVLINGYIGSFVISEYEGTNKKLPNLIKKDGSIVTPTYGTVYSAKDYADIRMYLGGGYLYYYYVTFN